MSARLRLLVPALLGVGLPADAAPPSHVTASLVAEHAYVRPGRAVTAGLRLQMSEGWHVYWKNPGDAGLPPRIEWRLPEGFEAGEFAWPRPERILVPPLASYGYSGETLLIFDVQTPATLPPGGEATFAGRAEWVECREVCIPGKAEVSLTLPVRAEEPAVSAAVAGLFARARALHPAAIEGWGLRAHAGASGLSLAVEPPAGAPDLAGDAYFFPEETQILDHAGPQALHRTARGYRLDLPRSARTRREPAVVKGVLVSGTLAFEVAAPLAREAPPASHGLVAAPGGRPGRLLVALLASFAGGFLLNLMPCVLPVLSLKVMGFVRHGVETRRQTWHHGLAFAAGVLVFFWVLAGALIALRAGGEQIGWGFQLQSPAFVVFLAGLFFLMGMNFFGVFEVGESLTAAGGLAARRMGLASSFWSGALATVAASPCTAPFMGSALGFALTQPPALALAVFTSLGLGMAFPYLVLARFPALLRFVPRPGPWMDGFRQLMGFGLMATVVYLCWLLGRQAGVNTMTLLLACLLLIAAGAWIYGLSQRAEASPRRRLARLTAAGLVAVSLVLGMARAQAGERQAAGPAGTVVTSGGVAWEPFSPERVAELRASGRPVFVDFTADWCLTCMVNEKVALERPAVEARFRELGIAALRADWTLKDERITRALAEHGRQGVPLYVFYPGDGGPVRVLPEVVTPEIVLEALR
jgi:thiol:disulfide interchange protein DsbD